MSCPSSSYDWIRMGTMAGVAENCAEKLSLPAPFTGPVLSGKGPARDAEASENKNSQEFNRLMNSRESGAAYRGRDSLQDSRRGPDDSRIRNLFAGASHAAQFLLDDMSELSHLSFHFDHFFPHVKDDFDSCEVNSHIAG